MKTTTEPTTVSIHKSSKIHLGLNHTSKVGLSVGDKVTVTRQGNEFTLALSKNKGKAISNYGVDIPASMTKGLRSGDEFVVFYEKNQIVLKMIED